MQQVEDVVVDADVGPGPQRRGLLHVHALLEQREARPALLVEGDDLPVEDRVGAEVLAKVLQFRIAEGDIREGPAFQPGLLAVPVGDRPHAVPLELERPAFGRARQRARLAEHRLNRLWHRAVAGPAFGA